MSHVKAKMRQIRFLGSVCLSLCPFVSNVEFDNIVLLFRFPSCQLLNCPHNEMKLKQKQFQDSFKTVLKQFCFSLISLCGLTCYALLSPSMIFYTVSF